MRLSQFGIAAVSVLASVATVLPQSPPASSQDLKFEVASVKSNKSDAPQGIIPGQRGGLTLTNLSAHQLIIKAYKLQEFQLVGGPSWINSERFDVTAKTVREATADQKWLMLQALLSDRFQLRVHREMRERQVFTLVLARKDRKLGPNIRVSPPPPCGVGAAMPCGGLAISRFGDLSGRSLKMSDFAGRALSFILGQTVRDGTGLRGNYDIDLKWEPETNGGPSSGAGVADRPSIYAAVEEQLGLKLESQKGQVTVLVIDNVERPTPD